MTKKILEILACLGFIILFIAIPNLLGDLIMK